MNNFLQNLRHAARFLRKAPGFTIACVLTIGLGIGANTAVFSLVNALLLRPLPYQNPERLVNVWESIRESGRGGVAFPNYVDVERENHVFEDLAAWSPIEADVTGGGRADRVLGENITPNYFRLLGIHPQQGRDFNREEESTRPVVIIGNALWRSRFGAANDVVGRTMNLSGTLFTVVGVMPAGFEGVSETAQLWVPISTHDLIYPQVARFDFLHSRDIHWVRVLGRLKDGVSLQAASAEVDSIGKRLAIAYPNENRDRSMAAARAQDDLVRNFRAALIALMVAVGFVLLVACANVSNLILVRISKRERELAVRLALGATRTHLLWQLLSETGLIAALGAGVGIVIFFVTRGSLTSLLPLDLPKSAAANMDGRVLAFAFGMLVFTALVLTLVPLVQLSRRSPRLALNDRSGRNESPSHNRIRTTLAIVEIALSVLLSVGAALMIKSLWRLQSVDPGFRSDHLVTLRFDVPNDKYQGDTRLSLGAQIAERALSVPGVESAAVTSVDPFVWPGLNRGFTPQDKPEVKNPQSFYYDEVTPGYFRTMNIPLISGRDFSDGDDQNAPGAILVSRSFAQRIWPGEEAIGKHLKLGGKDNANKWLTVAGIVGDAQIEDLHEDKSELAIMYSPLRRSEAIISLSLLARTKVDPASLIAPLRGMLQSFDPDMPVYSTATLDDRLAGESASARSYASLMAIFGSLAVGLALIGIYGVFAFSVTQRTREIGIRMALGAQRQEVLRMITTQALTLALVGIGCGILGAFVLTRFMSSLLFKVSARDPLVFCSIALLLASAAVVAGYFPARRAASVEPVQALRME